MTELLATLGIAALFALLMLYEHDVRPPRRRRRRRR